MTISYRKLRGNPEDSFAKNLLLNLHSNATCDAFYYDSCDIPQISQEKLNNNLIIIMIRDQFEYDLNYSYWRENSCTTVNVIEKLAQTNSNKFFVIATEYENIGKLFKSQNIAVVNIGGQLFDEISYSELAPVEKNFNSEQIGISLNRQMREHRLALIGLLHGLGMDKTVKISAMHLHKQLKKNQSHDILDHLPWKFDLKNEDIRETMATGFMNLCAKSERFAEPEFYNMDGEVVVSLSNLHNFNDNLRKIYANSFVEIISESTYESEILVTEKMLNAVYGCNFPIFIAPCGYVQYIRDMGFDVFDDIIDHSYDKISNPILRMVCAIKSNQYLFADPDQTKKTWQENYDRFIKNIEYARSDLYTWASNRATIQFQNILKYAQSYLTNPI